MSWNLIGTELPNLIITDLTYHDTEEILVAATYGRGMYTLDLTDVVSVQNEYANSLSVTASPNPARERVTLRVNLEGSRTYSLRIYSLAGEVVRIVQTGFLESGSHELTVHTTDLESGVYLARIVSDDGLEKGVVRFMHYE